METKKTSTGLQENVAGLLCYVAGWVTGIIFLLLEKDNKFIRFHAIQSIIVFGVIMVAGWVLGIVFAFVAVLGALISGAIWVLGVILWIVLMVKAYQGTKFKIPVAGDMAEKWAEPKAQPPQPPAPK